MSGVRIVYLDIVRIFACLLIVAIHSPIPNIGTSSYVLSSISFIATPGIGLFFMTSGSLLLPVREPTGIFLRRRLKKIVIPTLFWTLFYLLVNSITKGMSSREFVKSLFSIPFSTQGNSILWFMYTLIGLYLLAPIISPWLQKAKRKEIEWVLLLWGITLCYPLLSYFVNINTSNTGMLYYFSGYVGYFLLGYYLHTYRSIKSITTVTILLFMPLLIAGIAKLSQIPLNFYTVFWLLSITAASMAIAWFCIIQRFDQKIPNRSLITLLSNCCFGIYLAHIFIMRSILWNWPLMQKLGGISQILLTSLLTFIICFGITLLISYLPFAEYIIGFKQKK